SFIFSRAKAEKVVNPPQNPVTKSSFKSEFSICCLAKNPTKIPIIKQPKTFTIKVAHGKALCTSFCVQTDVRYRKQLPIPPPRPTISNVLSIRLLDKLKFNFSPDRADILEAKRRDKGESGKPSVFILKDWLLKKQKPCKFTLITLK